MTSVVPDGLSRLSFCHLAGRAAANRPKRMSSRARPRLGSSAVAAPEPRASLTNESYRGWAWLRQTPGLRGAVPVPAQAVGRPPRTGCVDPHRCQGYAPRRAGPGGPAPGPRCQRDAGPHTARATRRAGLVSGPTRSGMPRPPCSPGHPRGTHRGIGAPTPRPPACAAALPTVHLLVSTSTRSRTRSSFPSPGWTSTIRRPAVGGARRHGPTRRGARPPASQPMGRTTISAA